MAKKIYYYNEAADQYALEEGNYFSILGTGIQILQRDVPNHRKMVDLFMKNAEKTSRENYEERRLKIAQNLSNSSLKP